MAWLGLNTNNAKVYETEEVAPGLYVINGAYDGVYKQWEDQCLHDSCSQCKGTGVTSLGHSCVHAISCPCKKCSPSFCRVV